jgi:Mrp family chromosome partitioning ATPase
MSAILDLTTFAATLPMPQYLAEDDGNRLVHMLRHQRTAGTVAQLVATNSGTGTSSLARDLALIAVRGSGLRVLLLDLVTPGTKQLAALRGTLGCKITATQPLPASAEIVIHQLDGSTLHVSETRQTPAHRIAGHAGLLPALRNDFDLVLIDVPAADRSHDGVVLAPIVDTSLLIVEAEKTRAEPARNLRDQIFDTGGRIGGVVLNKRVFHLPGIIYRHI